MECSAYLSEKNAVLVWPAAIKGSCRTYTGFAQSMNFSSKTGIHLLNSVYILIWKLEKPKWYESLISRTTDLERISIYVRIAEIDTNESGTSNRIFIAHSTSMLFHRSPVARETFMLWIIKTLFTKQCVERELQTFEKRHKIGRRQLNVINWSKSLSMLT